MFSLMAVKYRQCYCSYIYMMKSDGSLSCANVSYDNFSLMAIRKRQYSWANVGM